MYTGETKKSLFSTGTFSLREKAGVMVIGVLLNNRRD